MKTQIQDVVVANEEFMAAMEELKIQMHMARLPMRHNSYSIAMEEVANNSVEEAKKTMGERFKAFIARIFNFIKNLFTRTVKKDEKAKDMVEKDSGRTHAQLLTDYAKYKPGALIADRIAGDSIRNELCQKALKAINSDRAVLFMLTMGGYQKMLAEYRRVHREFIDVLESLIDGVQSLKNGGRYRTAGIEIIGFGGGVKIIENVTAEQLPALLNYDRKGAHKVMRDYFNESEELRKKPFHLMDEFEAAADACIKSLEHNKNPEIITEIERLQKDMQQIIPMISKNLVTASDVLTSASISGVELNSNLHTGGAMSYLTQEEIMELRTALTDLGRELDENPRDYIGNCLTLISLDNVEKYQLFFD